MADHQDDQVSKTEKQDLAHVDECDSNEKIGQVARLESLIQGPTPVDGIRTALPSWPSEIHHNATWLDLYPWKSLYSHHPSFATSYREVEKGSLVAGDQQRTVGTSEDEGRGVAPIEGRNTGERIGTPHSLRHHYCVPRAEHERLLSIFHQSRGGSVLVTGYRGTGKTSFVNHVVSHLGDKMGDSSDKKIRFFPFRINLSTSRTAEALVMMMMKKLETGARRGDFQEAEEDILNANQRFRSRRSSAESKAKGEITEQSKGKRISIGVLILALTAIIFLFVRLEFKTDLSWWDIIGSLGFAAGGFNLLYPLGELQERSTEKKGSQTSESESFVENGYPIHEAQQELHSILSTLSKAGKKIVFIFDEVDKLSPSPLAGADAPNGERLRSIQQLVSDLKFLLTESEALHVFIAGKDVDDSWQEDQNKGEGLFESIFVQNIYLPSTLSANLEPALGPHHWLIQTFRAVLSSRKTGADFLDELKQEIMKGFSDQNRELTDEELCWLNTIFKTILGEIGIDHRSWTYNTGLLIIPLFSPLEIWKILRRYEERCHQPIPKKNSVENMSQTPGTDPDASSGSRRCKDPNLFDDEVIKWIDAVMLVFETETKESTKDTPQNGGSVDNRFTQEEKRALFGSDDIQLGKVDPMTERRIRRIRYLVEYLTYKGRGIPRKILREFYGLIQHTTMIKHKNNKENKKYWEGRGNIELVTYSPTTVRQKIKFFASIVSQIDANRDRFRFLNDKGCVATFHIIDHILKHFQTGFTWADLENATFMTRREELFPSRELLRSLLAVFEDHLFEARDRRHQSYRLLPRVKHDLADLYQAFGPEQIELRFTWADFAEEISVLEVRLAKIESVGPTRRHESVKSQMRLAEIFELLGKHQEARREYSKALRWIRADLRKLYTRNREGEFPMMVPTTTMTYLMSANTALSRLGYLYELDRDYRTALHYYETIIRFLEGALTGAKKNEKGLKFKSIMGPTLVIDPDSGTLKSYRILGEQQQRSKSELASLPVLIGKMVPEETTVVSPFTSGQGDSLGREVLLLGELPQIPRALHTGFESKDIATALNLVAVTLEKLWHRYASNRFLINALDYYLRCGDEYNTIDQMVFIGELMMRRRDVRLATGWYLAALRRATQLQLIQPTDRTSRQPEVQTSAKARLYEYLGDVWYATGGTAFVDENILVEISNGARSESKRSQTDSESDQINSGENKASSALLDPIQMAVSDAINRIRKENTDEHVDSRDEEYFYTQAAYHFGRNQQVLRQCDVSLKKIELRRNRLTKLIRRMSEIKDLQPNDEDLQSERMSLQLEMRLAWGDFWVGAERAFNSLIDANPGNRRTKPMDMGRIVDRRRYGELLNSVGRMLMVAAEGEIHQWCWGLPARPDGPSNTDLEIFIDDQIEHIRAIHPGRDLDTGIFREILEERIDTERTAEIISRIIGNLVDNQAVFSSDQPENMQICVVNGIRPRSPLWNLGKRSWRDENLGKPNQFLLGQLFYLFGLDRKNDSPEKNGSHKNSDTPYLIRTLYRAEIALLSAHLALDDNIRGVESAAASRSLGVLYLVSILKVFSFMSSESVSPDVSINSLPRLYNAFHIASKRYLVNAIDILRGEAERNRANSYELLRAQQALADLMTIRSEVLACFDRDQLGNDGGDAILRQRVESILLSKEDCNDLNLHDCRIQAFEAYRDCCRTILSDIEDYIKRYRFPAEAMYRHGDVMNRRLHWDIAQSIRSRHVDYGSEWEAEISVSRLRKQAQELSIRLFDAYPWCEDRDDWFDGLCKLFELLDNTAVRPSWIRILDTETGSNGERETRNPKDKGDGPKEKDTKDGRYTVCHREANPGSSDSFRYFRSFDDGLGREPQMQRMDE